MIDDEPEPRTEFVQVASIQLGEGVTTVSLGSRLRFDHPRGVRLARLGAPIPETATALAAPARAGAGIVVLEPRAGLRTSAALRLDGDTAGAGEYVLARGVARARAVVQATRSANVFPDDQVVKVLIVPNEPGRPAPLPSAELRQVAFEFFRSRGLIATRLHVAPPRYTGLTVAATVVRDFGSLLRSDTVRQSVAEAIRDFLSPLVGGVDGDGWEFGRPVFRSELYQLIEGIAGVDHVQRLLLNGDESIGAVALAATAVAASESLVRLDDVAVTVLDV